MDKQGNALPLFSWYPPGGHSNNAITCATMDDNAESLTEACDNIMAKYLAGTSNIPCYGWQDSPEGGSSSRLIVGLTRSDKKIKFSADQYQCCGRHFYLREDVVQATGIQW